MMIDSWRCPAAVGGMSILETYEKLPAIKWFLAGNNNLVL